MHRYLCFLAILLCSAPARAFAAGVDAAAPVAHPHTVCKNCHIESEANRSAGIGGGGPRVVCVNCHADVLRPARGQAAQSRHIWENDNLTRTAPLSGRSFDRLDCLSCHAPHFQEQRGLLRSFDDSITNLQPPGSKFDAATRVCLSCHQTAGEVRGFGRGYVRHPVGIPVRRPGRNLDASQLPPLFDVNGTADTADDVIGCTTCHYPHVSGNPFLLRWKTTELSSACLQCHPEVSPGEYIRGNGLVVSR